MEVAVDLLSRLRLKKCGMESKCLEILGIRCRDLWFSISKGCGTTMGYHHARIGLRGFWVWGCEWQTAGRRHGHAIEFLPFFEVRRHDCRRERNVLFVYVVSMNARGSWSAAQTVPYLPKFARSLKEELNIIP